MATKTSCILMLVSAQYILYTLTTTCQAAGHPCHASKRVVKKRQAASDFWGSLECASLEAMSINYPAEHHDKYNVNEGGKSVQVNCVSPGNCEVTSEMSAPCDGGDWKFAIYKTYLRNVTDLTVRSPEKTIYELSSEDERTEQTEFIVNSNKLIVDIQAGENGKVQITMDACCPAAPDASNPSNPSDPSDPSDSSDEYA